jgi:hypothetical protein
MIHKFETLTTNLNQDEIGLIEIIIKMLKESQNKPMSGREIINRIGYLPFEKKGALRPARLRKIVNAIRSNCVAPVIASNKGYSLAKNAEEITGQIVSLNDRIKAIKDAVRGLEIMYKEFAKLN